MSNGSYRSVDEDPTANHETAKPYGLTDKANGHTPPIFDAHDLWCEELPAERSLKVFGLEDFFHVGVSHVFVADAKAGKTSLLTHLALQWEQPVIYVTEEPLPDVIERLKRYARPAPGKLLIWPARGLAPDAVRKGILESPVDVVIIDTIRSFFGMRDENDNSEIAEVMNFWDGELHGKTRIYAHHPRKSGGEHGHQIAGGSMLFGSVSQGLFLTHASHDGRPVRKLATLGRWRSVPPILIGLDDMQRPVMLGQSSDLSSNETITLSHVIGEPRTTRQVYDAIPMHVRPSLETVARYLEDALGRQEIRRLPNVPKSGATYRYWRGADLRMTSS